MSLQAPRLLHNLGVVCRLSELHLKLRNSTSGCAGRGNRAVHKAWSVSGVLIHVLFSCALIMQGLTELVCLSTPCVQRLFRTVLFIADCVQGRTIFVLLVCKAELSVYV